MCKILFESIIKIQDTDGIFKIVFEDTFIVTVDLDFAHIT